MPSMPTDACRWSDDDDKGRSHLIVIAMPRPRPAASGYARIAQEEGDTGRGYAGESDDEHGDQARPTTMSSSSVTRYVPIQPPPQGALHPPAFPLAKEHRRPGPETRRGRTRSNSSGVDIKAINARLERWAEEIASKFKIGRTKGRRPDEARLEIHHSVFQPPRGVRPVTADSLEAEGDAEVVRRKQAFEDIVESVRVAIELGTHPKMISQGSSGSYFARNSQGKVVGVFKPKDEEPYASRNPKWTKWLHRNLFPCFFGRACLIPNLSYVSEAAAYVLDSKLRTNLVPYTDIVHLSSKSFFYDLWDRRSFYRKRKPLPAKIGSFQVFLQGFKDANVFLREHPWPDQHSSGLHADDAPRRRKRHWHENCRPSRAPPGEDDDSSDVESAAGDEEEAERRKIFWTDHRRQTFREELEKLVILDYIMRNTDRGLDNWMIKIDKDGGGVSIVSDPIRMSVDDAVQSKHEQQQQHKENDHDDDDDDDDHDDHDDDDDLPAPRPVSNNPSTTSNGISRDPYRRQKPMTPMPESEQGRRADHRATMKIGAIDNSLSWPWKHPDAWRSFPFGWLFLPVSLIGQPFSQRTRDHFLPLLTSTAWWTDTQVALRLIFGQDADFKERMFARQMAVMKGQAWNVVETLKTADHGPLELTRRARVYVWDDVVDIPVALPLRAPSAEQRRRRRDGDLQDQLDTEEMDISAANAPLNPSQHDLLGLNPGTPASEFPSSNRFVVSTTSDLAGRQPDARGSDGQSPTSPASVDGILSDDPLGVRRPQTSRMRASEPSLPPLSKWKSPAGRESGARHDEGGSLARRRLSSASHTHNHLLHEEDLEGDLGYAAAEGMEKHQRKVIVERLENVKSKNPVFSWC